MTAVSFDRWQLPFFDRFLTQTNITWIFFVAIKFLKCVCGMLYSKLGNNFQLFCNISTQNVWRVVCFIFDRTPYSYPDILCASFVILLMLLPKASFLSNLTPRSPKYLFINNILKINIPLFFANVTTKQFYMYDRILLFFVFL